MHKRLTRIVMASLVFLSLFSASPRGAFGADSQFGLLIGATDSSPRNFDGGLFYGVFLDFSLMPVPAGTLQGEIMLGLALSGNETTTVTALSPGVCTGCAPPSAVAVPSTQQIQVEDNTIIVDFGFRYVLETLHQRVRPYASAGPAIYISLEDPVVMPQGTTLVVGEARDVLLGGAFLGAGVEVRLLPQFSLGLDYRFNILEGSSSRTTSNDFSTFAARLGFHF